MPIIDTPAGTLEVQNAILSASEFRATQKISVANSAPTKTFSVGDKLHVSTTDLDAVSISGNLVAQKVKVGNLLVSPTFDLASVSNVGNTTSNIIQFANATTGFTTTANVEIGGNITLTSNAQVKVGSNVLAEYTGPHPREPKEIPIKKYPEIAFHDSKFDKNDTTNTYTQGGYTISANSQYNDGNYAPWEMYVDAGSGPVTGTHYWSNHSTHLYNAYLGGTLASPTGHTQTVVSSVTYSGVFTTIQLPHKIKLNSIDIQAHNSYYCPHSGIIAGSTNGSSWDLIHSFSDLSTSDTPIIENIITNSAGNTNHYNYFRLIITKGSGAAYIGIRYLRWNGTEEPSETVGDLSLDTTLKSTFNSVQSNNYVMYFDGEDPANGNVPKNLVNGSSITITPNNAVFDATNNCWTLNGSTESNVTTADLGFEGDVPHTVSMWVNVSNLNANTTTQQLFSIGSGYDKALVRVDNTQIAANTWHNVTCAYQGEGGSKVTYVDGRKVEEERVEDTTGAYPPFAMTDYETGGFRVSASSTYGHDDHAYPAWEAFDETNPDGGNGWLSQNSSDYNNGTGLYEGTIRLSPTTALGEWIKLELPFRIYMQFVEVAGTHNATVLPRSYKVYGSNDDENWYEVLSRTDRPLPTPSSHSSAKRINADDISKAYKYFAFVVTKTRTDHPWYIQICEMKYFGHKEGDLTRFPEPTRVLKYPTIVTKNGTGEVANTWPNFTSYAQRGHIIKASSWIGSYPPYAVFNGQKHIATGTVWVGGYNQYGTNHGNGTGGYGGSRNLKTDLGTGGSATSNGEWLYIEMPHKIKVTSTKIVSYDTSPSTGHPPENLIIYGTNDPSSSGGWNVVDNTYASSSSGIPNSQVGKSWAVSTASNPTAYKYFAYVLVKVNNSGTLCHAIINDWQLIGTQEDTQTPAIVGGPFAGKVANFRVYDQYLGEERIQEIYDAQKDAFGHKKSSMTFYKGRVGVGTTEPEGALAVLDEPHTLEKFPARDITANHTYVENQGLFNISSSVRGGAAYYLADYGAWKVFSSTSNGWKSYPGRDERVSEEVDFGAWLKMETPESISLKKAEITSISDWVQVGSDIFGSQAATNLGISVDCTHDGTRIIAGAYQIASSPYGEVRVYDWDGATWVQVGNTLTGGQGNGYLGYTVAISGDGSTIAAGAPFEDPDSNTDRGIVRVFKLTGGGGTTWTILSDSGSETTNIGTNSSSLRNDVFMGSSNSDQLGRQGLKLSYDGKTILMTARNYDDASAGADSGQARIYTYSNGAWSKKGDFLVGSANDHLGYVADMSEDGNCIILGGHNGTDDNAWIYIWDGSSWVNRGASGTNPAFTRTDQDGFGQSVAINNDGTVIAFGLVNGDIADGALSDNGGIVQVYHWSGSAWVLKGTLNNKDITDDEFGSSVKLSGDGKRIIVGARDDSTTSANNGRLYTWEYDGSNWFRREPYTSIGISSTVGDDTEIGFDPRCVAISRDGSTIVSGEFRFNSSNGGDSGRVRIFSMPSNIKSIWGSNDDKNWTKITTAPTREEATSNVAGVAFRYTDRLEFKNLDNPNYYKYHAIVADAFTCLENVKLFGVRKQGSSTLHDGALTLTKNLEVPRIGAPPDVDNTPRRDRLMVEYNTSTNPVEDGVVRDTSGRGNDACMKGSVSYSSATKSLNIDGVPYGNSAPATPAYSAYLDVGQRLPFKGNQQHTISFWYNKRISSETQSLISLWKEGTDYNSTGQHSGILQEPSGRLSFWHWGADQSFTDPLGDDSTGWRHVAAVYTGTTVADQEVYINGIRAAFHSYGSGSGTATLDITNAKMTMGQDYYRGNYYFQSNTRFSGIKIYDTILTPEEIRTLYDMGRCDEGHHVVNFSKTRVGIGLGDGEIPQAALDVRGDIYRNGVPAFPIPTAHFFKQSSSTTSASHYANIQSGWIALTHAPVTVPGVIEAHSLTGANTNTDGGNSGTVVKLCKEGLYKIQFSYALSTQTGLNSHIGVYIRPVSTTYISENTGTDYIDIRGDADGYDVVLGAQNNAQRLFHRFEILRVTKAPGYAYVTMTPNSNISTHFRFQNYGDSPYAVMNVMYLG